MWIRSRRICLYPAPSARCAPKVRQLAADTQVMPHSHPWAQVAISTTGVIRLTVDRGTYIVPPSRALWIPPGVEHAVTMVEDADLRTLYFHQPRGRCGPGVPRHQEAAWRQCRVLEVSDLLRALVRELPTAPDDGPTSTPPSTPDERTRERHLNALVLGELRRAAAVKLGVDLPHDKRLRHLCEAVLADPTRHETLSAWAQRRRRQPAHGGTAVSHRASSTFHAVAPAGDIGQGRVAGCGPHAHGADCRRTGLQPQRLQRHGAQIGGAATGAVSGGAAR